MNIHTGLRFGQEDLEVEMVTGWGVGETHQRGPVLLPPPPTLEWRQRGVDELWGGWIQRDN